MRKFLKITAFMLTVCSLLSLSVNAAVYDNYTYSNENGEVLIDPDAYLPEREIFTCSYGIGNMNQPIDMDADKNGDLYVLDAANNRIVVLDLDFSLKRTIACTGTDQNGEKIAWNSPQGIYVCDDRIFICDTENNRILIFDKTSGNYMKMITSPEDKMLGNDFIFKPIKVVTDDHDNLYVVSKGTFEGVLALKPDGSFTSFFASNKVTSSSWDLFWRRFSTKKQRKTMLQLVPQDFSSISADKDGFFFVTTFTATSEAMVQRINPGGKNVIRSQSSLPLKGDPAKYYKGTLAGESSFSDVTAGAYRTYACLDKTRNKIFCYNYDGYLLYSFGNHSDQTGGFKNPVAVTALPGEKYAVLDSSTASITVFAPTTYAKAINKGISYQNELNYEEALKQWKSVLGYNSHYMLAINMIGNAYYNEGKYETAMNYFKECGDKTMYSTAKKQIRSSFISSYSWVAVIAVIALIVLSLIKRIIKRVKSKRRHF